MVIRHSIHKTTVVLGGVALLFTIGTGVLLWQLHKAAAEPGPRPDGTPLLLASNDTTDALKPTDAQIRAQGAVLWDTQTEQIVFAQNAFDRHPIASLTKLMTAMVALDHGIPWDQPITLEPSEYVAGGNLLLFNGETATMRDLFTASLMGSANNATLAYVRGLGISPEEYVRAMNRKAVELGLEQTTFVEVTGLNPHTISTAYEVAKMASYAFTHYPEIAQATQRPDYQFTVGGSGRQHSIKNTNTLVADGRELVSGSKTGYLDEAKYCLVMAGQGAWQSRIAVTLASDSQEISETETQRLLHRE